MPMHPKLKATALFAAAALGGGAVAAAIGATTRAAPRSTAVVSQTPTAALASATSSSLTAGEIYRHTVPGVVQIRVATQGGASGGFGPPVSGSAQGTGFVIDTHGDIVTNEHVVADAISIRVTLSTGVTYTARLVGANASEDVAVVRIAAPASALHPLRFADSRSVQVGAGVVAIGDPYGLTDTATSGIVSAVGRTITSPNNHPITGAIQTDAAINSGNSGGPLLDAEGLVIGINSQIESQSGGNVGIGFAVPANTVRATVAQMLVSA